MSAIRHRISHDDRFDPADVTDRPAALTLLRRIARDSRCKSYVDLFGACAALSGNRQVAAQAACEVLILGLQQALGRRPVFYREDEHETSFDENWLLALARSLRTDDTASVTFLLHSRVHRSARRNLIFLLNSVFASTEQV
ncbi:hypothetical protein FIU94_16305 [Sulfitobacter sp. THAF37]|uniref:hypothetical protein n=1 Tax=Sulfitobacter sp. THAF37 TaxID=2587855 RepID=UPI001267B39F|nr:hypothetical protein [Sulfitobacter sp. THAF37]QFT60393.1 hypothetical protein FIU94_16305 [Sulfitobacter sp. THAF37]